jgi:hypothetical protein
MGGFKVKKISSWFVNEGIPGGFIWDVQGHCNFRGNSNTVDVYWKNYTTNA